MHCTAPQSLINAGLTADEVQILARIYFDGLSQRAVAADMGINVRFVCEAHKAALVKIQAANLPLPKRPARHRRRAHRPTFEPTDPALLNRVRLSPAGRWSLGTRRVCDSGHRHVDRR